jgi:hypothetical protein
MVMVARSVVLCDVMCCVYKVKTRDIHAMSLVARRDEARRSEYRESCRLEFRLWSLERCYVWYVMVPININSSILSPLPLACAPLLRVVRV